jgi:hypothetical protein
MKRTPTPTLSLDWVHAAVCFVLRDQVDFLGNNGKLRNKRKFKSPSYFNNLCLFTNLISLLLDTRLVTKLNDL